MMIMMRAPHDVVVGSCLEFSSTITVDVQVVAAVQATAIERVVPPFSALKWQVFLLLL
jgi:hypothetical protein